MSELLQSEFPAFEAWINGAEREARRKRATHHILIWTGVLKRMFVRERQNREAMAAQLFMAELDLEAKRFERAVERIAQVKCALSTMAAIAFFGGFGLVLAASALPDSEDKLRSVARAVRIVRGGRRDG